jgi:hypothetical protein
MLVDLDRARDVLRVIPPDLPRDEWVRAGMAAHAAGLPFDELDACSAGGGSYDARAARDTWRSFKDGMGLGPGTLFKMAAQAGWSPGDKRARYAKAAGRHPAPLQVRAALLGITLHRLDDGRWHAGRWNLSRELRDLAAVAQVLEPVGGSHA